MVTLAEMQEAVGKARKSGAASARASRPKRKGGRRAKSIGLMTSLGAAAWGLMMLAEPAQKLVDNPTLPGAMDASATLLDNFTQKRALTTGLTAIGVPFLGKLALGRSNPGIGVRKRFMVRLF